MPLRNIFSLLFVTIVTATLSEATPAYPDRFDSDSRLAARSTTGANETLDGCSYQVEGVGAFNHHLAFDFTTMDTLPDELIASTYEVGSGPYAPYSHIFNPSNIVLGSGQPMQMIVPGGQTADPLETCQVVTRYDDVLYASVRTVAQASPVNGTVHGFFMYMNDTQETDIEIRTGDPGHVHFTNQQTHPGNGETTHAVAAPSTMASAFHEYRYDWLPTGTNFYIDGMLVMSINRNVPSEAGWLMWNSWSNGYAWTFGPPAQDNILLIRSVEAYFNRTSTDTSECEADSNTGTGSAVTTAGAHVTMPATTAGNLSSSSSSSSASSTTETEASQSDDGTSNLAPQTSLPNRQLVEDSETSVHTIFENAHANTTLQAMITIGIAPDATETLLTRMDLPTIVAAYMPSSLQQLLPLHMVGSDSI
ncbi:concanavalin A-like lectin/glucanase, partial [Aureobasidium melanogenum]